MKNVKLNSAVYHDQRAVRYEDGDDIPEELVHIRCQAEDSTLLAEEIDALHFGTEDLTCTP